MFNNGIVYELSSYPSVEWHVAIKIWKRNKDIVSMPYEWHIAAMWACFQKKNEF